MLDTSNGILGWLMAGVAAVGAVVTSAVRNEKLRNRVDSIDVQVGKHESILTEVRRNLHDIRNSLSIIQALSERDNDLLDQVARIQKKTRPE